MDTFTFLKHIHNMFKNMLNIMFNLFTVVFNFNKK